MQISATKSVASIASLLCIAFTLCPPAKADTYALYDLEVSSGYVDNIGLTADGTLVMLDTNQDEYITFTAPSTFATSPDLPPLTFSNGTPCALNIPGFISIGQAVCNNGYEAFVGQHNDTTIAGLFAGPNPVHGIYHGPIDNILLDPMGDIAFVSINNLQYSGDVNFLAIDLTSRATPEPSSLALLGTALLGAVGILRKKRVATHI